MDKELAVHSGVNLTVIWTQNLRNTEEGLCLGQAWYRSIHQCLDAISQITLPDSFVHHQQQFTGQSLRSNDSGTLLSLLTTRTSVQDEQTQEQGKQNILLHVSSLIILQQNHIRTKLQKKSDSAIQKTTFNQRPCFVNQHSYLVFSTKHCFPSTRRLFNFNVLTFGFQRVVFVVSTC